MSFLQPEGEKKISLLVGISNKFRSYFFRASGKKRDIFEDFTAAATSLMTVGLNLKTFVGNGNLP